MSTTAERNINKHNLNKPLRAPFPRISTALEMGLFKRSFFNDLWGGLGGVETGKIENEPAAARTRKGSVRSPRKGG